MRHDRSSGLSLVRQSPPNTWFCTSGCVLLLLAWLACGTPPPAQAQQEYEIKIETTLADTTETFWLQIPSGYEPTHPCPLLIGWHQLGGDHMEFKYATIFDSIANARGWIVACHDGVTPANWANHPTQSHVADVIRWIGTHYAVDADRIYMVGASMGGAGGIVFANNHLDPAGPMIAAAASVSGIQDCERRYIEQGGNQSMIAAFGGTPEEVPYEYHRNSAVYFADSTQSLHRNVRHLPLLLVFGHGNSDLIWRQHAEDLYAILAGRVDTVAIHESALSGHGWSCVEEPLICDFLEAFTLQRFPLAISVSADEEGRWYWTDIRMRAPQAAFAHLTAAVDPARGHLDISLQANVAQVLLDLASIGLAVYPGPFTCQWDIRDAGAAWLGLADVPVPPSEVLRDGLPDTEWVHDPDERVLWLHGEGSALYTISFDPAGIAPHMPSAPIRILSALDGRDLRVELPAHGWLRCTLFDALGRQVGHSPGAWCGPGSVTLPLGRPPAQGVFFAMVRFDGPYAGRAIHKLISIH